jgi:hypothetical protein
MPGRKNEFNGIEYLTVPLTSTPMMICVTCIHIYTLYNFSDTDEPLKLSNFHTIPGYYNKILNTYNAKAYYILLYYTNNVYSVH